MRRMRCALTCLTWFHEDARELYKIQSLVVLFFWTEKTFCKNIRGRRDSPTDTQASRAVANRIFILSVLNELNGAPTLKLYIIRTTRASLRIDSNYLNFRPFYVNWTKEITWCSQETIMKPSIMSIGHKLTLFLGLLRIASQEYYRW